MSGGSGKRAGLQGQRGAAGASAPARRLLVVLALAGAGCAPLVTQRWSPAEQVLGAATLGTIATDCAITHHRLATDSSLVERNPYLGRRPSPAVLWTGCALGSAALVFVADRADQWRPLVLGVVFGLELWTVLDMLGVIDGRPLW